MAIWTENTLNNHDGFIQYQKIVKYAKNQGIFFKTDTKTLDDFSLFLSVEDLRIIDTDLAKLNSLYDDGVRFASLFWKGVNQFGGAWDTTAPLTSFGKQTVLQMIKIGIIPDISHSNIRTTDNTIELCSIENAPFIASHSNSFDVCNHKRNISKEHFLELVKCNGILGISLCNEHLSNDNVSSMKDILKHIDFFLCLNGENSLCLGCDFDGVSSLPIKFHNVVDIVKLHCKLVDLYGERVSNKIFFENAFSFINRNLV